MKRDTVDRFVDFTSVVLISVAAVLTAFCGWQSAKWAGQQTRLYNIANAYRLEGAEAEDRANALTIINAALFVRYFEALEAGDTRRSEFIYRHFPAELKPAVNAWLATDPLRNPKAPNSPFALPQYAQRMNAGLQSKNATAAATFDAAVSANQHSDDFVLLTVIFAGVSFLGGVSTKMMYPRHLIIVVVGILALLFGLGVLVGLPIYRER